MPSLPDSAWFSSDKDDLRKRIREQLERIRWILLSTDARSILSAVESIDARIAEFDADIREAREAKYFNPGKEAKYDARIVKYEARRRELEAGRENAARAVRVELDAIGLHLTGEAAEKCPFTVNVADLVDAAVVAKHVEIVVEALAAQMKEQGGDIVAARRYYGVYVAMLEVQKLCFDDYLAKSRCGPWRQKLADIRREAGTQRSTALDSAGNPSFTAEQREAFR